MSFSDLKLFALSSNQELAKRVAKGIGMELGKSTVRQFSDGRFKSILKNPILRQACFYFAVNEFTC